jgi:hypothetical protein
VTQCADPLDFVSELEERERVACAAFRHPVPPRRTKCNGPGCEEPLLPGTSFCGHDCRDAYEATERR